MLENNKEKKKLQQAQKLSQLKWACRRGMLELDIILLNFLNDNFQTLNENEQKNLEVLLGCADPELLSWLFGQSEPPEEFAGVVDLIKQHANLRI